MAQLSVGHWAARLVYVAAKLELADLLAKGPRTAEDLAGAAGAHGPALYRVLRALASLGVLAEMKGRRFKLTPLGATLRTDVPGSMWSYAVVMNETYLWDAWGELLHGVRTGETPFEVGDIQDLFRVRELAPQLRPRFRVVIAQPGLSASQVTPDQLQLLAGAAAYLRSRANASLVVYCNT